MNDVDVTLLCGSRPELLKQTLSTFSEKVFPNFSIGNVYVNVDLHGGGSLAQKKCSTIVRDFFPQAKINLTAKPNFTKAVCYLWKKPKSKYFLHLEDDWIALSSIFQKSIDNLFVKKVKQVQIAKPRIEQSLLSRNRWRPYSISPIYLPNFKKPSFATSPSFIESDFANEVALLINKKLNPEKQMFNGMNPELENFLQRYVSTALVRWWQPPKIKDIGRDWLVENGLENTIIKGKHGYKRISG
jgi:hypothetical protein